MELVPFRNQWAGSETKLDLKGLYKRPSVHGGFSLTGPLPLRRHLDWTRKGFEFVTLATLEDLGLVAPSLRYEGLDVDEMRKAYDRRGAFDLETYLKTERTKDTAYLADLQIKVDKYGPDAVTDMMTMQDPSFVMPPGIVARTGNGKPSKAAVAN